MIRFLLFALLVATPLRLPAVCNIIVSDRKILANSGFEFSEARAGSKGKTIRPRVSVPPEYNLREVLGNKLFAMLTYLKPEIVNSSDPMLIGRGGMRLRLFHWNEEGNIAARLSFSRDDVEGTFLEFNFNQGSGYPPMLIHVPLQAVVDYLATLDEVEQKTAPSQGN